MKANQTKGNEWNEIKQLLIHSFKYYFIRRSDPNMDQCRTGSIGNKWVLHILQGSWTWTSPPDAVYYTIQGTKSLF